MLINGAEQTEIDARDRGLQYGDGCFTTILVKDHKLQLWSQHKARLIQGLNRLGIIFTQWQALESSLQVLTLPQSAVVKIQITRGLGGRGYAPPEQCQAQWLLSVSDFPQHYQDWQQHGVDLGLSAIQLAKQPLLAGIKHLNRLEQVLIKQDALKGEYDDVIVCDTDGMLIETSAANLFWYVKGQWYTPDLYYAGVSGVMRNQVLALIEQTGQKVQLIRASYKQLSLAESGFICNSLMQIVPISSFLGTTFDIKPVKQIQQQIGMAS